MIVMMRSKTLDRRWSDRKLIMFSIQLILISVLLLINESNGATSSTLTRTFNNPTMSSLDEEKCAHIKMIEQCPELKYNMTASLIYSKLHGTFMNIAEANDFVSIHFLFTVRSLSPYSSHYHCCF